MGVGKQHPQNHRLKFRKNLLCPQSPLLHTGTLKPGGENDPLNVHIAGDTGSKPGFSLTGLHLSPTKLTFRSHTSCPFLRLVTRFLAP